MDVCYLINSLGPGGAPTLLLNLVRELDGPNMDFTVTFIEGDNTLAEEFKKSGARVVDFDANFKFDPRALWRMASFFSRESFDVIHTHLPYAQTLGRIFSLFGDHKAVVSTQHNFAHHFHPITRTTEKLTRRIDDTTIAVSKAVKSSFFPNQDSHPWEIIYNGVDVSGIMEDLEDVNESDVRKQLGIPIDSHIFLNVGRLVKEKSQNDLIKAIANMENRDAYLLVVGWGPKKRELQQLAAEENISHRVVFTGKKLDVFPYYAVADTFVSTSTIESFGIVLVEAMVAGLPIIATDVAGSSEVLNQARSGVQRIPPNSPDELVGYLDFSMSNSIDTGYEEALEKFDIKTIANSHLELYSNLIERA